MDKTLKWLYHVPGEKRAYIPILTLLQVISGGIGVLYALLLRSIVDSAAAKNEAAFWESVIRIILLVIVQLAVNALLRYLYEKARTDIENIFKMRLTGAILNKDFASVSAVHSAEWLNRLTNDAVVAADGYVEILPGLTGSAVRLIAALVMIIVLERWFACILIPGGILMVLMTYLFRRILKRLHKNIQTEDGKLRIFLQERISSLMLIKSFGAEAQTAAGAERRMRSHQAARMARNRFSNLCNIGFGAALQGMYILGAVYCAYGIMHGTVTYGTLAAIIELIGQVQAPLANITGYLPRWYAMTASAERLMEIESFADDHAGPVRSAEEINDFYRDKFRAVCLENAGFTYYPPAENDGLTKEKMPVVLRNLSIFIQKGEIVAFTGPSGCGKSTVLKLLMSMFPLDEGQRFLELSDGTRETLNAGFRRLFAYVPQGNALMSGTIRDAVSFADPSEKQNDGKLSRALMLACADEFVNKLENKADTLLGERGAGLSEGQLQRLAVARAVFSDAPILLLDEATSALDEETEKRLLENLRSLTDNTVIIVTHRKAALEICDRVIRFGEE